MQKVQSAVSFRLTNVIVIDPHLPMFSFVVVQTAVGVDPPRTERIWITFRSWKRWWRRWTYLLEQLGDTKIRASHIQHNLNLLPHYCIIWLEEHTAPVSGIKFDLKNPGVYIWAWWREWEWVSEIPVVDTGKVGTSKHIAFVYDESYSASAWIKFSILPIQSKSTFNPEHSKNVKSCTKKRWIISVPHAVYPRWFAGPTRNRLLWHLFSFLLFFCFFFFFFFIVRWCPYFASSMLLPAVQPLRSDEDSSLRQASSVELRRHHAGRTMRWTPRIIGKDNGAVAQIVRNNIVAADIVRK